MKVFLSIVKFILLGPLVLLDILLSITMFCLVLTSTMMSTIVVLLSRDVNKKTILKDYYEVVLGAAKQALSLIIKDWKFIISDD